MIGRGTRLCPDLFGPGKDKEFFYLFDYCQNLEFFSQNPEPSEGVTSEPLSKRLFKRRLEIIQAINLRKGKEPTKETETTKKFSEDFTEETVRNDTVARLHEQIAAMNLENFVVRPKRLFVEKYAQATEWQTLDEKKIDELGREVSGLPSALVDDDEEAKRFDLLIFNLQLCVLNAEPGFDRFREQVRAIAAALEDQSSIPAIRDQIVLIEAICGEGWWKDVTVSMLEVARRRIRSLVKLIEKGKKKIVYTDFEDELGAESEVELPEVGSGLDFDRYKAKVRQFLKEHLDHIAVQKVRRNAPLTKGDLDDLEALLKKSGVGSDELLEHAKTTNHGLGLFIRSLVGLDREAATQALGALFQTPL